MDGKQPFKEALSGYELFDDYVINFTYILMDVNRYTEESLIELSNLIGSVFLFNQEIGGQDIVSRLKKTMERTLKKEFMEAETQGEAREKIETRREIAIAMIRRGLENTLIAEVTGLTMEQIDELRQSAAN